MIFITISSTSEEVIKKVSQKLLMEDLVINVNIERSVERWEKIDSVIQKSVVFLLTAKTKSLLFTRIEKLINDQYGAHSLEIYSLPIIHMDFNQTSKILSNLKSV